MYNTENTNRKIISASGDNILFNLYWRKSV